MVGAMWMKDACTKSTIHLVDKDIIVLFTSAVLVAQTSAGNVRRQCAKANVIILQRSRANAVPYVEVTLSWAFLNPKTIMFEFYLSPSFNHFSE